MDIPVITMIVRSGLVARVILLILAVFSIMTWAVIFRKWFMLFKMKKLNRAFRNKFAGFRKISEAEKVDGKIKSCSLGKLAVICSGELKRIISDAKAHKGVKDWSFFLQNQFSMSEEALRAKVTYIGGTLDSWLSFLAIVSSVAPFIGLLGTVWGIMNSFYQIGNQGSASLPVVAPGIAEALITTIIGLAVAIPAVFFYNLLIREVQRQEDDMEGFGDEIMLRLKREIFSLLYSKTPVEY